MKSIHEAVKKELELQQVLNDAVRGKERDLRQLQKVLLNALYLVNRVLDVDVEAPRDEETLEEPGGGSEPPEAVESANSAAEGETMHEPSPTGMGASPTEPAPAGGLLRELP